MASDRVEVDTARPFRSVKEAVAVFGERILVGESNSRYSSHAVAIANSHANATPNTKHSYNSSSSVVTLSPNAMAEAEAEAEAEQESEATAAIVPMYSAPSSPPSITSPQSAYDDEDEHDRRDDEAGLAIMSSIKKLEAEVADTRREVGQLRKRGTEMEMAVASLNARLHRGLSRLAEIEADKASAVARRSIGGDTDVTSAAMVRSERWAEKSAMYSSEYLPSFSHALSLGEFDDDDDLPGGGRRRKGQKVKPIVPLIGDIIFSKSFSRRKSAKDSGDLYSVC